MITDTTTFVSAWADRKDEGHDLVSTSFIGAAPNSSVIDHVLRAMIMKPPKEITPLAVDLARSSPGAKESRPVPGLVERFDRRGTEPFEPFRSEFG